MVSGGSHDERDEVSRYIAARLQEMQDAERGPTQTEIGKRGGVSGAFLSEIRSGKRGAGRKGIEAAAKIFGMSKAQLHIAAEAWAKTNPASPARTRAKPRRYPNLDAALAQLDPLLAPETKEAATGMALHSPTDLDVATWTTVLLDFNRKMKSGEPIGQPVSDEDDTPPRGR